MSKASTQLLEQGTQTPSPAPDLIPAETKTSTENSHWDRYSKWGHFSVTLGDCLLFESDGKGVRVWLFRSESAFSKYRGIGNPEIGFGRRGIRRWLCGLRGQYDPRGQAVQHTEPARKHPGLNRVLPQPRPSVTVTAVPVRLQLSCSSTAVPPVSRFGVMDAYTRVRSCVQGEAQAKWSYQRRLFVFNRGLLDYLGGLKCILEREPLERLVQHAKSGS